MSDRQAENTRIEDEHRQLHAMAKAILSTLAKKRMADFKLAEIGVLRACLQEHFATEEEIARHRDPELHRALHDGHDALILLLDRAGASLADGRKAEGKRLLAQFGEALARHDAETDIPLFALMARGSWANSAHYWDPRGKTTA